MKNTIDLAIAMLITVVMGLSILGAIFKRGTTEPRYVIPPQLTTFVNECAEKNAQPKSEKIYSDRFITCLVDNGIGFTFHGDTIEIGKK